jgi:hypothetical protein
MVPENEPGTSEPDMIELIDLTELRYESRDLSDLQSLVKQLIGQPFRFFRIAYGDELRLHIGHPQSYSNPRMRERTRGSYILGARASSWVVYSAPKRILLASASVRVYAPEGMTKRVDIKQVEHGDYFTSGALIVSATSDRCPTGFTLYLTFADGTTVFIGPNSETYEYSPDDEGGEEDMADMEISDWEILTPHSRVLRVGPGERWCYIDSNKRKAD